MHDCLLVSCTGFFADVLSVVSQIRLLLQSFYYIISMAFLERFQKEKKLK